MKVNFTKIEIYPSFEAEEAKAPQVVSVSKYIGNLLKYECNKILDIKFEDLARDIYYSTGDVEVPDEYVNTIYQAIIDCNLKASVKRGLLKTMGLRK